MNIGDYEDIYDKIPNYSDPLAFPKYRDFSNSVALDFNPTVRSYMKDSIREIWENAWSEIDPDGELRSYLREQMENENLDK